jgi:hypothetical protein
MRKKVRGLRGIEQRILDQRRASAAEEAEASRSMARAEREDSPAVPIDSAGDVVLDYCAAVRGILNDDQGGPLHPPGLRMTEALDEVRQSIDRNVAAKKGGSRRRN